MPLQEWYVLTVIFLSHSKGVWHHVVRSIELGYIRPAAESVSVLQVQLRLIDYLSASLGRQGVDDPGRVRTPQ
jgi:hypothetical protein